jgi:cell division protease FtsH
MQGRDPRPPKDWTPNTRTNGGANPPANPPVKPDSAPAAV